MGHELQAGKKRPIGDVFAFLSGLYFRGKRDYAQRFARASSEGIGAWVITSNQGLLALDAKIGLEDLRAFSETPIVSGESRYENPLRRDLARLIAEDRADTEYVLLGSVSTDKYAAALLEILGERLLFPIDFVGRGDMSRGGLMLRQCRLGVELEYALLAGATRKGKRPPKLKAAVKQRWGNGSFP